MKTILEINKLYYPWIGGVEQHVRDISTGIKDNIRIICCNTSNKTIEEVIDGINVTKYASFGIFASLPISFSFILNFYKHKADVLHFHLPNPLAVMAYFIFRIKGDIIVTWHADITKQKFALLLYKPFLHWFLRQAKRIIVTSPNIIQSSPHLSKFKNKITVIPLGINPKKYLEVTAPNPMKKKYALFVGRFIYYKGVLELIEALKQSNVHLVMIGDGTLKKDIIRNGHQLIESDQLTILPFQDDITLKTFFKHCEYLILPSTHRSEAFGIVQLEAMIYSKPVISTNLPTGVPYVNKHNTSGLIVEPKNINELAIAMNNLWNNPELTKQLGKNAYKRCESLFLQSTMINKTKELIKKL